MAEELDAGGGGAPNILVITDLQQRGYWRTWANIYLQSIHLKEVKWREHPGQVAVVDDEEVCNFPGLDVDGRFGFYPVSAREVGGLKDWILDIDINK